MIFEQAIWHAAESTSAPAPDISTGTGGEVTYGNFWQAMWDSIVEFFSAKNLTAIGLKLLAAILVILFAYLIVKGVNALIYHSLSNVKRISKKMAQEGLKPRKAINYSVIYFCQSLVKFLVYIIAFFIVLGIFGADFSSFGTILAGAVAGISLSLQDLISSFAYGVVILTAQEFSIGDYVMIVGGPEGTVKLITLLYTVLVTVDGSRIYIPNSVVGKSAVSNTSTEPVRRVDINFAIPNSERMDDIRKVLIDAALTDKRTLKSPAPYLAVVSFAVDSTNVSLRVFTKNEDYWDMLFAMNEKVFTVLQQSGAKIGRNSFSVSLADKSETKGD